MSLATRCAACGTVFRVVEDQLQVSEGWVRCGHCQEVFNALEALFDLEREAPPEHVARSDRSDPATDPAIDREPEPQPDFTHTRAPAEPADETGTDAWGMSTASVQTAPVTPPPAAAPASPPAQAAQAAPVAEEPPPAALSAHWALSSATAASPENVAPGFLRSAAQANRWQSPRVRALLGLVAVLLLVTLALQVAVHFRDHFAARWPAAKPWLTALCEPLGCEIQAPRHLAALTVEASGLSPEGRSDTFLLTLTLRNRDTVTLATPMIDLSLTDTQGALLLRRALAPADFRRVADGESLGNTLAPGAEWPLQTAITVSGQTTSGYTVELFYP